MTYRLAMLPRAIARALIDTKDVDSIAGIVHHQYALSHRNQNQASEERLAPREFSSLVVSTIAGRLPAYDTKLITEVDFCMFLNILALSKVRLNHNDFSIIV